MKIKELNYQKGRYGEDIAKEFLINRGYELVEMNYENKIGEIDLIMIDGEYLVFVEVKYKSDDKFGLPEEMINQNKLVQIRKVAESYLMINSQLRHRFLKYRIDAVCILGRKINYYKNLI